MNKVLIVLMFILLGTSLIVVSNMGKDVQNSFTIVYENNQNEALPDITSSTEIIDGLYRLYDNNGITVDYNIYNGIWAVNGQPTNNTAIIMFYVLTNQEYAITYKYVSGSISNLFQLFMASPNIANFNITPTNYQNERFTTTTTAGQNRYILYATTSVTFNNLQFKIQVEKGSHSTPYVVPKLVPVYKDNLTQQEKNEIGLGAFGGITKIIKTINDIIKPIGDFINGLLSIF